MTGLQTSSCCLLDIYLIQAAGSNKGGKQQGNNKGIVESIHRTKGKNNLLPGRCQGRHQAWTAQH
jgi:hypothetical protein